MGEPTSTRCAQGDRRKHSDHRFDEPVRHSALARFIATRWFGTPRYAGRLYIRSPALHVLSRMDASSPSAMGCRTAILRSQHEITRGDWNK